MFLDVLLGAEEDVAGGEVAVDELLVLEVHHAAGDLLSQSEMSTEVA